MSKRLALNGVHIFKKVKGTNHFALSEVHPALGFTSGGEKAFLQDGQLFDAGGHPLKGETPGWVVDAIKRANPQALAEAGWRGFPKAGTKGSKAAAPKVE